MTFSCQRTQLDHAFAKKIKLPRTWIDVSDMEMEYGNSWAPSASQTGVFPLNVHFLDIQIEHSTIAPLALTHGVVLTSTFFHTQQDNKANNMGISVRPIFSPYYFESLNK